MNPTRLITLLKSPVEADTLIGINYMINQYLDEEIINFFNMYGDYTHSSESNEHFISNKAFARIREQISYVNYYTNTLTFYIGTNLYLADIKHSFPQIKRIKL